MRWCSGSLSHLSGKFLVRLSIVKPRAGTTPLTPSHEFLVAVSLTSDPAPCSSLGAFWLSKAAPILSLGSPGNRAWEKACFEVLLKEGKPREQVRGTE